MRESEISAWHDVLKNGDEEDIVKWPCGRWAFRFVYQDDPDGDGRVPEDLRGQAYQVAPKGSAEWVRLQEAKRIVERQGRLNVSDFYLPPTKFTDEFIENLGLSAKESSRVGDGARVMHLAQELHRASRSSHATGDAQRARALQLHNEVLSYVDSNVVMDDRFRVMRAQSLDDQEAAVALLEQVTAPSFVPVARAMIVEWQRAREGRSVANMRRIGDLQHRTTSALKEERVHARALIRKARKTGNREQGLAATTQLYKIGVTLVLAWDSRMRKYGMTRKAQTEMDASIRRLMDEIDEVDLHRHGLPEHKQAGSGVETLSAQDLKWIVDYLGGTTKRFCPIDHLDNGGSWSL